jgi:hypothetical protein
MATQDTVAYSGSFSEGSVRSALGYGTTSGNHYLIEVEGEKPILVRGGELQEVINNNTWQSKSGRVLGPISQPTSVEKQN